MLAPFSGRLKNLSIVLGSSSPRRQAMLRENLGFDFTVVVPSFAEDIDKSSCTGPDDYVKRTCRTKCIEIIHTLISRQEKADLIIAADTIVVADDLILEKPSSPEHACSMIATLSGKRHSVLTSVTIALRKSCTDLAVNVDQASRDVDRTTEGDYLVVTFCERTDVTFAELPKAVIQSYVATGEPLDKAGGYGIQALGSSLVRGIEGCYFNVVGFPLHRFCAELTPYLLAEVEGNSIGK
jgi:septum formation protein